MTTRELLSEVLRGGARLWVENGKLRVRAPAGALSERQRAELQARRDEIVQLLSAPAAAAADDVPAPALERGEFPLSSSQRRIWFMDQLAPDVPLYHVHLRLLWRRELDEGCVRAALEQLAARHEILRSVYRLRDGSPVQQPQGALAPAFSTLDLSGLPEEEAERRTRDFCRRSATEPFDLARGPLVRLGCVKRGPSESVLAVTMHHVACDAQSVGLFLAEFHELYEAARAGRQAQLPGAPFQYGDWALWEQRWLASDAAEQQRAFWKSELAELPALRFPDDTAPSGAPRFAGETVKRALDAALWARLEARAQELGVSTYVLLLAGFALALRYYTGCPEFGVATVVAGRLHASLRQSLGCFVNTLIIPCRMSSGTSLAQFVAELSRRVIGALANQELPFDEVVAQIGGASESERQQLARACLVFEPPASMLAALPWLTLEQDTVDSGIPDIAKFDLMLALQPSGTGAVATYQFATRLFPREAIERLAGYVERALQILCEDSSTPVEALALMTPEARRELAERCRRLPIEPASIHRCIEQQAARTPSAVAVCFEHESLSFEQLDEAASELAESLRGLGAGPDARVAVCTRRGIEAIVAVLGVLKSGAAYVPIDPAYPLERQRFMLDDAEVRAVVLSGEGSAELASGPMPCVRLGALGGVLGAPRRARARASADVGPERLAYVMYTSGSTGRPKGVAIEHGHVASLFVAMDELLGTTPGTWLAATNPCFDISVVETLWVLARGGTVVVCEDTWGEHARQRMSIPEVMRRWNVTHMQCTPSRAVVILEDEGGAEAIGALACLIVAGEAFPVPLARRLASTGVRRIINGYGPTEATVYAVMHDVRALDAGVPIGTVIANARGYVLDDAGRMRPEGAVGELYIGGAAVARGYLNRDALTAERFLPDPFRELSGARMYRTGDLVRYGRSGLLEYLGRVDHQVKLRGYRIELGEIEKVLDTHPAVRRAVVVLNEDRADDKRLIAYCACEADAGVSGEDIKGYLAGKLPSFMLPAQVLLLPELPTNSSGKVDRKRLPAPARPVAPGPGDAPSSAVEERVAAVWREVLGLEQVGVDQGFFELGGHSVLAAKLRHRTSEVFGVPVPLVAVFEHPTVRAFAAYLGSLGAREAEPARPAAAGRAGDPALAGGELAIVGIACRFPGASDAQQFWGNLLEGRETIHTLDLDALRGSGLSEAALADRNYVPRKGVIEDSECFDAAFFGFTPSDARLADPQQRVLLECAWHALEDAGKDPSTFAGRVGVFAGAGHNSYLYNAIRHEPELIERDSYRVMLLNEKDFLATRLSHRLDLRGPALALQTACSTSLVAVHYASQSLLHGECDLALAGGVSLTFPMHAGYTFQSDGIQSADGHCRPFSASACGTVFGCGVGVVVLRRLADALRDGDRVYAVIKGSAVNNDGAAKVGFTAPSVDGQADVIRRAHAAAGVTADSVSYVEAHGTATALGDDIELRALERAFAGAARATPCRIGSVKSNLGHLDAAAGVAGLIKTALALRHAELPATLHAADVAPALPLDRFQPCIELSPWPSGAGPRRAGVSSFGIGGTNAHVVLEEAPEPAVDAPSRALQIVPVSARSREALRAQIERLGARLREQPGADLADVAYTLQTGRRAFAVRACALVSSCGDVEAALASRVEAAGRPAPTALAYALGGSSVDALALAWLRSDPQLAPIWQSVASELEVLDASMGRWLKETATTRPPPSTSPDTDARLVLQLAGAATLARALAAYGVEPRGVEPHAADAPLVAFLRGHAGASAQAASSALRASGTGPRLLARELPAGSLVLAFGADAASDALGSGAPVAPLPLAGAHAGRAFYTALAELWQSGIDVSWRAGWAGERRRVLSLPGYAFERQRFSLLPWPRAHRASEGAPRADETAASARPRPEAPPSPPASRAARSLAGSPRAASTPLERQLLEVWERYLGVSPIGVDDDFFELGGDSFMAVEIAARLRDGVSERATSDLLLQHPNVAALARCLAGESPEAKLSGRLASDAILTPDIRPVAARHGAAPPRQIVLTGASGFLGAFILRALLTELPECSITCLVRERDRAAAWRKLERRASELRLLGDIDLHRVSVVLGDLSAERFGWSDREWSDLARRSEAVVHAGAVVNFASSHAALRGPNVLGTATALRLACEGVAKPFHHVSTLAVFEGRVVARGARFHERSAPFEGQLVHAYAETKWAAERLVEEAGRRGLPVAMYRPGPVAGDSVTGACNVNDVVSRLAVGLAHMRCCPAFDQEFFPAAADHVARAIALSVRDGELGGDPLHLINPHPARLRDVAEALRAAGYELEPVSLEQWRARLQSEVACDPGHPLYTSLPLLEPLPEPSGGVEPHMFSCAASQVRLALKGLACAPIGAGAWRATVAYLEERGLLPGPSGPLDRARRTAPSSTRNHASDGAAGAGEGRI